MYAVFLILTKKSCKIKKISIFAADLVALKSVKRESGESPGQSRCCEFNNLHVNTIATAYRHRYVGRLTGKERVRRPAKSEKNRPAFEEKVSEDCEVVKMRSCEVVKS